MHNKNQQYIDSNVEDFDIVMSMYNFLENS